MFDSRKTEASPSNIHIEWHTDVGLQLDICKFLSLKLIPDPMNMLSLLTIV